MHVTIDALESYLCRQASVKYHHDINLESFISDLYRKESAGRESL